MSEKKVVKITNHIYQPKHEILPKDQAEEILKKYNAKPSQLPYVMISDKALEDLDVRPGDIIKITTAHGGRVTVKSALREGSAFTVQLPAVDERAAAERVPADRSNQHSSAGAADGVEALRPS